MSTAELKEKLIVKIKNTDDNELLMHISDLIEFENNSDIVDEISDDEIAGINDGREQIKNGQFVTNEESNKRVDEWVKRHAGL